jgi:MFS transporter, ACDE family, multidrug resistance protein
VSSTHATDPAELGLVAWLRQLPGPLRALLAAALVNYLSAGLTVPLTVLFVSRGLHDSVSAATLTVSVTAIGATLVHPVIGRLSDRRTPYAGALVSLGLGVAGTLLFASASSLAMIYIGALLTGLGQGSATAWPALLAAVSPERERPRVFATNHLTLNIGMGGGLLIAGLAMSTNMVIAYRLLYAGKAVGTLVLIALIASLSRRVPVSRNQARGDGGRARRGRFLPPEPILFLSVTVFALFTVGYAQLDSGFTAGLADTRSLPGWTIALALVANTLTVVVINAKAAGPLSQMPPRRLLTGVPLFWSLAWLITGFALAIQDNMIRIPLIVVASVVFAIGEVAYAISVPTLTANYSPQGAVARSFAAQNVATSIGYLVGPALTSALLFRLAPGAVMLVFAAAVLGCLIPVAWLRRLADTE